MTAIVAIGGISKRSTKMSAIDKEILRLSGKKHPRLLFIPTASSDDSDYCIGIRKHYERLGCSVEELLLFKRPPSRADIERMIQASDIIYVGGGNTLKMMRLWRRLGVDRMLKQAHKKGVVLCGVSAGSICWFESGHSDSMSYYNAKKWTYIRVKGLGLIKGIHCPHYDSSTLGIPRRKHFQEMIAKTGGTGIAIDDDCAIAFINGRMKVIATSPKAGAYWVRGERGAVNAERMKNG